MAIKTFKDLKAWQLAVKLAAEIYKLTSDFPANEQFGLTNQLRRASVSISSNIAEGFGRNGYKEKDQFYAVAFGSLLEVESQMLLSIEIGYLDKNTYNEIESLLVETQKVLVGLKKSNLTRKETLGSSR